MSQAQKLEEAGKDPPQEPPGGSDALPPPDLGPPASRTGRAHLCRLKWPGL